jgi:hypothetical protein
VKNVAKWKPLIQSVGVNYVAEPKREIFKKTPINTDFFKKTQREDRIQKLTETKDPFFKISCLVS